MHGKKLSLSNPILVQDTPESIGMTVPSSSENAAFSVRDVANVIGHAYPVSVIDVRHQEELEGWTMGDLVEYFEDEERLGMTNNSATRQRQEAPPRKRRAAAAQALEKQQHQHLLPKVLNQISLEFSSTPLRKIVQSPQFVRDLDWIDHAWPAERRAAMDYPMVQYYCLTSTACCYTDFHVDFGGTAVWYHVLKGEKQFVLVKPTTENLAIYEDWLCRPNQSQLFLPDLIQDKDTVLTVSLKASQTLVIPTGWIHAVYTPTDSIVIGGNFLHGLDISLQLQIHYLETRTRVPGRFRFPHFLPLQFYAGGLYLRKLQSNATLISKRELEGLEDLISALEGWWKLQADETMVVAAKQAARSSGCESVEEMLTLLKMERARRLLVKQTDTVQSEKPKLRLKLSSDTTTTTTSPRIKLSPPRITTPNTRVSLSPSSRGETKPNADDVSTDVQSLQHNAEKPTSTGIRIRLSPEKKPSSDDFRIVLPPSSRSIAPTRKRKSLQREGLDEFIPAHGDDEWEPERPKRQRPKATSSSLSRSKGGAVRQAKSKPSTTSRQRLMKRFR